MSQFVRKLLALCPWGGANETYWLSWVQWAWSVSSSAWSVCLMGSTCMLRCVQQPGRPLDGCCRGRWCGCSLRWRCPRTPCGWRSSGGLATNTRPRCSRCWTCAGRSRCFVCSARMESYQPSPRNSLCPWSSGNIPVERTDTHRKQIGISDHDNIVKICFIVFVWNVYCMFVYKE